MKVSFLIGTLFFLVISCNKVENKPVEDYKVIETDHFIIKSKYDFGKAKQLMENELPKEILSKDTLNFVTLTGDGEAIFMLFDEKLVNDENKFKEKEYRFASIWNKNKTTIYHDTIINSNKIELSEVKMDKINSKSIYLSAKIIKKRSCYLITLFSKDEKFNEDKKVFFEILEGTTIKK